MNQVHKESLSSVENALPNRQGLDVEIFGMEGIPEDIVQQHNQRIIQNFYQAQAERFAATGNPPPGQSDKRPAKKFKAEGADEIKKRLAEHRARLAAQKGATGGSATHTPPQGLPDGHSPAQSASPGAFVRHGLPPYVVPMLTASTEFPLPPTWCPVSWVPEPATISPRIPSFKSSIASRKQRPCCHRPPPTARTACLAGPLDGRRARLERRATARRRYRSADQDGRGRYQASEKVGDPRRYGGSSAGEEVEEREGQECADDIRGRAQPGREDGHDAEICFHPRSRCRLGWPNIDMGTCMVKSVGWTG